jgi:thymidylate kinase
VLTRKQLLQSEEDLTMAGALGMLAFSNHKDISGWRWSGNPASIADIFSLNAIPLAYLGGKVNQFPSPLLESTQFIRELRNHEQKYHQWKKHFRPVRDAFLSHGVRYVFIKSPSLFPYTSGNLDVLVREQDFDRAAELLRQSGFVELRNIREPHKHLYKQFDCGKEVIAVHLHSRVFWGATFIDPNALWSNANGLLFDDVVFPLSAEDCLLTTLAHSFYENSAIRLLDLCVAKELVNGKELNWPYLRNTAAAHHWEDGFHLSVLAYERLHQSIFGGQLFPQDALDGAKRFTSRQILLRKTAQRLESDRLTMPFYLPLFSSKLLAYKKISQSEEFGSIHRRLGHVAKLLFNVLLVYFLRVNPQKGMLIAISGMDGSGKSSHASALVEAFHNCGLNAHYQWTRAGSQRGFQSLTKLLFRRFAGSRTPRGSFSGTGQHTGTRDALSSRWRYIGWKAANVLDSCVFYNLALRLRLLKGQVVICDRFIPDIFADLHVYEEGEPSETWLKLLCWLLPRPAVSILLTTPPDVAQRRSRDPESMEYLQRQARLYRQTQKIMNPTIADNGRREFRDVCNDLTYNTLMEYYTDH